MYTWKAAKNCQLLKGEKYNILVEVGLHRPTNSKKIISSSSFWKIDFFFLISCTAIERVEQTSFETNGRI